MARYAVHICGGPAVGGCRQRTLACPVCERPTLMLVNFRVLYGPPEAQCTRCGNEFACGQQIGPPIDDPESLAYVLASLAASWPTLALTGPPPPHQSTGLPMWDPPFDYCLPTYCDCG